MNWSRVLVSLSLVGALAATSPAYLFSWWRQYNGTGNLADEGHEIRVDAAGNSYSVGPSVNQFGLTGVALVKYNQSGGFQWHYRIDINNGEILFPYLEMDGSGNLYVACTVSTGGGNFRDIYLTKISPAGAKIWDRLFSVPNHTTDDVWGLEVDAAGNSYVLTESVEFYNIPGGTASSPNICVTSYSANGVARWNNVYRSFYALDNTRQQNDHPVDIRLDQAGSVVVAGYSILYLNSETEVLLRKINSGNGSSIWTTRYSGLQGQTYFRGIIRALEIDPANNPIVAGFVQDDALEDADILTIKYDSGGNWQWTRSLDGGRNEQDTAFDVTTDQAGRVYTGGEARITAGRGFDAFVARYEPNGAPAGNFIYSAGFGQNTERFLKLQVDAAGVLHAAGIVGFQNLSGLFAGWIRYFPNGSMSDFAHGAGSGNNAAYDMAIAGNGDVFLTGVYGADMLTARIVQEPYAADDAYDVIENSPLSVPAPGVMANDTYSQGGTAVLVSSPSHGTVNLSSSGTFTYTPQSGYLGPDSFTYKVQKGSLMSFVATVELQIQPILSSLTVDPSRVPGGAPSTGRVSLAGPAPSGGITISLSSSNPTFAQVPSSVTVPSGSSFREFTITTGVPSVNTTVTITASRGATVRTAELIVGPLALIGVSVSPVTVVGGNNVTGTVSMSGPANGNQTVTLTDNSGALQTPPSVVVPSGQNTANFTIGTSPVGITATRHVFATFKGNTRAAAITLIPVVKVAGLSLNPSTVQGGQSSTGTVTLNTQAPPNGVTVTLWDNSGAISTPPSVFIPAGSSLATFTVATTPVGATFTRQVFASYGGATKAANLTLTP